eukprot:6478036-Amphidinium_carterae.2
MMFVSTVLGVLCAATLVLVRQCLLAFVVTGRTYAALLLATSLDKNGSFNLMVSTFPSVPTTCLLVVLATHLEFLSQSRIVKGSTPELWPDPR